MISNLELFKPVPFFRNNINLSKQKIFTDEQLVLYLL